MNRATQLALNRINQRFYANIAEQWSHKRKHAWPGFERLWGLLAAVSGTNTRVLDVGCGDGRFAQFLSNKAANQIEYLGIDNSPALLEHAQKRALAPAFRFEQLDFVAAPTPIAPQLQHARFQLITLLGVLHHVPCSVQRTALVHALGELLRPGGHLVFTVWRLDEDPRFASRVVSFDAYNRAASEPIALDQLEPGDSLLSWDDRAATPRYCHFPTAAELSHLIAASGLEERERYRADGHLNRMNEYVVLRAH
jgi:SAM-dependent methyltransferase